MRRIAALIVKELQALLRDPQGRVLLVAPVVVQLAVFSFAATLEVKNNTLAVYNEDAGAESVELIQRFSRAKAFTELLSIRSDQQLKRAIDQQRALVVVRFPPDFSRALAAGRPVALQAILDGRRSNSGQIALGYIRQILEAYLAERPLEPGTISVRAAADVTARHWFNPNLDYVRHIIPSLVAIITTISTLVVTALSVARERERGTFDQLLVSPLTPGMIIVGKTVPALMVATFQASIIVSAGILVFGIPFQGSVALLYGSMAVYILAVAGFGLLLSSICSTQQQAFLGAFSFLMPAVLLSGFPSPVENMPAWLQAIDWFNPLRHFIVIVKGVFLKNASAASLLQNVWPLFVIGAGTMAAATWLFRKRRT